MVKVIDAVQDLKPHQQFSAGVAASGVCFVLLAISGLFAVSIANIFQMIGICLLFGAVVSYNLFSPVDQRFELGTRSADHQYGPFTISVKSIIEYEEEEESTRQQLKTRTINCEAVTEDGEILVSERDTEIVGSKPLSIVLWFILSGGDDNTVQSTKEHVREVSARVKDDAVVRIANGGNDPSLKAALETELGEEWYPEESEDSRNETSPTNPRTESTAGTVPNNIE